jgi:PAS domain S-box-containing protein
MKIITKLILSFLIVGLLIISLGYILLTTRLTDYITANIISSRAVDPYPKQPLDFSKPFSLSLVFLILISIIIIISVSVLTSRAIVMPLKKLKDNIKERDFDSPKKSLNYSNDEIGDLAKEINNKIEKDEKKFKDFLDNANDLIQSIDINGKFIYVNKKWLDTLGYSEDELKNLTLKDILRKDQIPHCMELFKKVVNGETLENIETVFVSKNKKEIFVQGNINPKMLNGKFIATRAIFRNITDKKRTEFELEKRTKELERINKLAIDREIKMSELKKEIKELAKK